MSEVHRRNRKPTNTDHIILARNLRREITRLMKDEKVCPKRSTFYIGQPCAHTARSVVSNLMRAEQFYPSTMHSVIWRKHYYSQAIADCHMLEQDLELLKELNEGIDIHKFAEAARILNNLVPLLVNRRKNVRKAKAGAEPSAFDVFMYRLSEFFNGDVFDE